MTPTADPAITQKQTHLQRTLTAALNELPADTALAAIFHRENGPLVAHGAKGFTAREVHTILRTLTGTLRTMTNSPSDQDGGPGMRLRLVTPSSKSLLAVPLRHRQRAYGVLVLGRKDSAAFAKKERAFIESACDGVTKSLEKDLLFDGSVILSRPLVAQEPVAGAKEPLDTLAAPSSYATPENQEHIAEWLTESGLLPFDRAWVTHYDPLAGSVEVVAVAGELKADGKRDLKPGLRLALEASASGWAVRHRKPRVDHDLASTQGRFADHKHLYKDRFQSSLVVPFFVRGQVGGTVTFASKEEDRYAPTDAATVEPLLLKLVDLFQKPAATAPPPLTTQDGTAVLRPDPSSTVETLEPTIRKQERQAAIGEFSAFLATELREPLASIRAQLEEVTGEGILDFDPQTRIEKAMRDLIRIEALLNEILDFAKPLELNRRLCRVQEVLENALAVVATELEVTRIQVTKDYAPHIAPVRCDEAKMQQVLLSIFKNSIEAMTPGGELHIGLSQHRAGRGQEVQITIKNNGAPIPPEHLSKVFEPFFSTKRSGTGLGLASVKKIVEEHGGHIGVSSAEGDGTTTTIRLPAMIRRPHFRHRGRGRRGPRPQH